MVAFAVVVFKSRDKIKKLLDDSTDGFDGMGGESRGPGSKGASPGEESDEEWGWGDGNANSGNVELSVSGISGSYRDEVVHKRHTSFDNKESPGSSYTTAAPTSGGLSLSSGRSSSGGQSPQAKLVLSGKSSPQPIKKAAVNAPRSAPATTPMSASNPSMSSNAMPIPQRITSLGKRIPKPPPKPKAAAPPQEDDIFASMGLSSKPKFSKPTPGVVKPSTAPSASRWAAPSSAPAPTTTTTVNALSAGLSTDQGSDDDWGDDDDLNDLLDD
eukprot:scaffold24593_cov176-Cylindrotheca_fusiformis.AAC.5